ncbi:MAG: C40 family peptidase [Ferruginibacter sp.]
MNLRHFNRIIILLSIAFLSACKATHTATRSPVPAVKPGTSVTSTVILKEKISPRIINAGNVSATEVVTYAERFLHVPYLWAGTSPDKGFDCSGLIFYTFRQFKINTPRVSKEFTNAGTEVSTLNSMRGDIILFTGSDPSSGVVGHMGLITENHNGIIRFIHAASGEGAGVIISPMSTYYVQRFVKVIRVFKNM